MAEKQAGDRKPQQPSRVGDGTRLRVIIADDDPISRRVLRDVLQEAGVVVVAAAANGRDAVDLAVHYAPDVVLMDATLPGIDGIAAMRRIIARRPEVRVVILSVSCDADLGLHSLRAGASGFLTKDIDIRSLPRTLETVRNGEVACSRFFVSALVARLRAAPDRGIGMRPVKSRLTPREWEVLDLLCEGANTDAIADQLVLSTETIRSHVKNMLRKLGVGSRREAIALAPSLREGTELPRAGEPASPGGAGPALSLVS